MARCHLARARGAARVRGAARAGPWLVWPAHEADFQVEAEAIRDAFERVERDAQARVEGARDVALVDA